MKELHILVVSDGLPGHLSQSHGLAHWLGTRFRVQTQEVEVRLRMRAMARRLLPPMVQVAPAMATLRSFHQLPALTGPPPDLVVSAGGNTSFANVLLARHFCVPNVFIGSRRRLAPSAFAAHLTLEPTGEAGNVVTPVAPSPVLPEDIAKRGAGFREAQGLADEKLWLMACGGAGAGKTYGADDWTQLGHWMNVTAETHGVRWLLSTSRRTGPAGEEALATTLHEEHLAYAVWWNRRPERILGTLMGAAERLFVTVDSMSMISECISAEKPVTVVDAGDGIPEPLLTEALDRHARLGLCRRVSAADPLDVPPEPIATAGELRERSIDQLLDCLRLEAPVPGFRVSLRATHHRSLGKRRLAHRAVRKASAPLYRLLHPRKPAFTCPVCNYEGPFRDKRGRRHAKCPSCGALERTRLLFAVLSPLLESFSAERKRVLHIAPEAHLDEWLEARFNHYISADLQRTDVGARLDIQHLPFPNATFDLVIASHVLEYPEDDRTAIAEIRRVLRPGGVAALPVPLMRTETRDLPHRDPTTRVMHEPGLDYFHRMESEFAEVRLHRSDEVAPHCQPFVHASTAATPPPLVHKPNMRMDIVPICHAGKP